MSFVRKFYVRIFVSAFWKALRSTCVTIPLVSKAKCVSRVFEKWRFPSLTSQTFWCRAAPASLGLSLPLVADCNALFLLPPPVFPISCKLSSSSAEACLR